MCVHMVSISARRASHTAPYDSIFARNLWRTSLIIVRRCMVRIALRRGLDQFRKGESRARFVPYRSRSLFSAGSTGPEKLEQVVQRRMRPAFHITCAWMFA